MKRGTETQFGPPVVSPGLKDPIAAKYEQEFENRKRQSAPYDGPPIPRLDQSIDRSMTMADAARVQRAPPPSGIIQPSVEASPGPAPSSSSHPSPRFFPTDILPEAARQDPNFQRGAGEMYATSQPALALKYGVLRNGSFVSPQQLSGAPAGLSPETVSGLNAAIQFQKEREKAESPQAAVEADAASGLAGQAARMGQSNPNAEKPLTEEERKKIEASLRNMDDFDFHTFREMTMKDLLNNEEQRRLIESRLEPMDLADLLVNGMVTQSVQINSKLTLEFQSSGAEEDLALKRLIIKEAKDTGFHVDDKYILDKYSVMSMTVGIRSINKKPLIDYRDAQGHFDDRRFWDKFAQVARLNIHLLASIGINFFWFDVRVRKLYVAEALGNG